MPALPVRDLLSSAQRVLAVSPHLDDAVLSAGGTLALCGSRGAHVTVLTLFAGHPRGSLSPVAVRHHQRCGLPADATAAMALRRAEDEQAVMALGATPVHATYLDAVYRHRPDGRWVCESDGDMFGPPPADESLLRNTSATITDTARLVGADLLLAPAAVGGHLDHVLVREVSMTVGSLTGLPVILWKDQPYGRGGQVEAFTQVALDASWLDMKAKAAACYGSQVPMLWSEGSWRQALLLAGEAFRSASSDWAS